MNQLSGDLRHDPDWVKSRSSQRVNVENGRSSRLFSLCIHFCLGSNTVLENWHKCVQTNLLRMCHPFFIHRRCQCEKLGKRFLFLTILRFCLSTGQSIGTASMLHNGSLATSRRQNHSCSVEFNLGLIETLYFFIYVKIAPPQQLLIIDVWFEIANCCSRLYHFFAYSLKKTASNIWIKNFTDGPKFIQQMFYCVAKQIITQ